MELRPARDEDLEACVGVLAALPDYFTPSTFAEVRAELLDNPAWVAVDGPEVLGFVLAPRRFSEAAEITFAAVVPARRNSGIRPLGEMLAAARTPPTIAAKHPRRFADRCSCPC